MPVWSVLTCGSTYRGLKLPLQLVLRKLPSLHRLQRLFRSQTSIVALRTVLFVIALLLMPLKFCQSLFVGVFSPPLLSPFSVILHAYMNPFFVISNISSGLILVWMLFYHTKSIFLVSFTGTKIMNVCWFLDMYHVLLAVRWKEQFLHPKWHMWQKNFMIWVALKFLWGIQLELVHQVIF